MPNLAKWIVLRHNTNGSIDALPLPEAVSVLSALVSAETYDSRLAIASSLVRGNTIIANGCKYHLEAKHRPKAKGKE